MRKSSKADASSLRPATRLVLGGRDPLANHGFVNPPVHHASTVLYRTAEDFLARRSRYLYGRRGSQLPRPSKRRCASSKERIAPALRARPPARREVALLPSGLAAISTALLSVLQAGDHVLVTDSIYLPTRKFCDDVLKRYGIDTTYYDPMIGSDIAELMKPNTRAVFIEAPGSLSFEVQDVPAIAAAVHAAGALVLMDNTWASPLYFRALEKGVDLSIQAGTKYIGGHSDVMLGTISANAQTLERVNDTVHLLGLCVGPDDMYLGLRGLRTMCVRLAQHHRSGLQVARWLASRPEIARVLHPALESCPGHSIWQRDFSGASGLFSIVFRPVAAAAVNAFLDELTLFGIGASWGGFESLAIPFDCASIRTATKWTPGGPTVRLHIGLEDVDDLIGDLERGFAELAAASAQRDHAAPVAACRSRSSK